MNVDAARGGGVRAFAPGRIEIAGNHVDHQGGRVIAAAIEDGVEVVAHPNGKREVARRLRQIEAGQLRVTA